jgi:hypothetical protein
MLSPGSITNSVPDPDEAIRLQRDTQRNAQEQASARSLQQSQIGAGGLLISGGGSLTIQAPGTLNVAGGVLNSGGSIAAVTDITAGGTLTGAALHVTGNSQIDGNETVNGTVVGTAGVTSPGARALTLGTWVALQIDPSGRLGLAPSSVRYKQDFRAVDITPEVSAIYEAALVEFRYTEHVDEVGDDAIWQLGVIAEYFEAIGLGRWVYRNLDGEVDGVQIERLTIPLIATVQDLNRRVSALEALAHADGSAIGG